jgi:hypothetical protein
VLIVSTYLADTNTRHVLAALFGGAARKNTVSRVWRKSLPPDLIASKERLRSFERPFARGRADLKRLIPDGTVVRVRLDHITPSISLLVVIAVRKGHQKVLLAVKNMGSETIEAWQSVLDEKEERTAASLRLSIAGRRHANPQLSAFVPKCTQSGSRRLPHARRLAGTPANRYQAHRA